MTTDSPTAAQIEAATPPGRDRYVDLLRIGSLFVVVFGHWFMGVVGPGGEVGNALAEIAWLQPVTWLLQIMPVFFLVGGVAHAITLDRLRTGRGQYAAFLRSRAVRLGKPSLVMVGTWLVIGLALHATGLITGPDKPPMLTTALRIAPQLMWFVGVYLGVAAFAPAMYRLHRRFGLPVAFALCLAAVLVDVVRFNNLAGGASKPLANLNFLLVWLGVHQFGFAWHTKVLTRKVAAFLAVGGFAGLLAAVTFGPYPVSMVGLPGEPISNMGPPTAALLCQALMLIGLAVLARPAGERLLSRPRAWAAVVLASPLAMTVFLWHLTALFVLAGSCVLLGIGLPAAGTATWWLTRIPWFALLVVGTIPLVALFRRFDTGGTDRRQVTETRWWVSPLAVAGAFVTVTATMCLAVTGVDVLGGRRSTFIAWQVTPLVSVLMLLAGTALIALARPRRAES